MLLGVVWAPFAGKPRLSFSQWLDGLSRRVRVFGGRSEQGRKRSRKGAFRSLSSSMTVFCFCGRLTHNRVRVLTAHAFSRNQTPGWATPKRNASDKYRQLFIRRIRLANVLLLREYHVKYFSSLPSLQTCALAAANGAVEGKAKGAKVEANGSHAPVAKAQLPPLPTVEDVGDIEVRSPACCGRRTLGAFIKRGSSLTEGIVDHFARVYQQCSRSQKVAQVCY